MYLKGSQHFASYAQVLCTNVSSVAQGTHHQFAIRSVQFNTFVYIIILEIYISNFDEICPAFAVKFRILIKIIYKQGVTLQYSKRPDGISLTFYLLPYTASVCQICKSLLTYR